MVAKNFNFPFISQLSASIEYIAVQEANLKKIGCCRLNYELNVKFIRAYVWTTLMIVLCLMGYDLYATLQYYPKLGMHRTSPNFGNEKIVCIPNDTYVLGSACIGYFGSFLW